ncbi:HlyD family type I secretion periplasmic adaptor subunit [Limnobacter parvus]|uniref:Membrane fusion protein (MFP) family protein n=1 Tax=Limnobacter parvus TaxID=2939690 RepID=A0ABT1XD81_9BURK|nr:HlyD family type I secretion periplasmic adaptor subunit [Limnobacter parvus]MCR2745236.1 HlyD family type I secretion periplasmic adaptor subunit [Limnobacter parvus]
MSNTNIQDVEFVDTDDRAKSKLGWIFFLVGFVGFMVWAFFAPLDQGALLQGQVTIEGSRKTIQHFRGGIIEEILVTDGQKVKEGDVLIRMNPTRTEAELEQVRSRWISIKATQARLLAEIQNKELIEYPAWFAANADDTRVQGAVLLQNELFNSRASTYAAEIAGLTENISALESALRSVRESINASRQRIALSDDRLNGLREMAEQGYLPRNRLIEAESERSSLGISLAQETGRMAQLSGQLAEARQRLLQVRSAYLSESQTQLTEIQNQSAELDEQLKSVEFDEQNSVIKSPVSGYVVGLKVFTEGGVIGPGEKLMDIAPSEGRLEIDGRLDLNLVDKVATGMPVSIKFSGISATKTPELEGALKSISADSLVDERTGVPYYSVRILLTDESLSKAPDFGIQPGMMSEVFINTGERTLMNYLFKPLMDRVGTSFTEH